MTRTGRRELRHGVNEIVGSSWFEAINSYNRVSLGTDYYAAAQTEAMRRLDSYPEP